MISEIGLSKSLKLQGFRNIYFSGFDKCIFLSILPMLEFSQKSRIIMILILMRNVLVEVQVNLLLRQFLFHLLSIVTILCHNEYHSQQEYQSEDAPDNDLLVERWVDELVSVLLPAQFRFHELHFACFSDFEFTVGFSDPLWELQGSFRLIKRALDERETDIAPAGVDKRASVANKVPVGDNQVVIDEIQEEDFDYLESLFSPKALAEAENFAADLNYLFSFFEGKVLSYEFQAGLTDDGKNEGNVLTKDRYWYSVTTDKKEYLVFFFEYPRDQENPDNEGLYMLQVIEMKDKERLFDIGQDILVPGVYVPEG